MASAAWYQRLGFAFEFLHRLGDGSPLVVGICSGDAKLLLSEHSGDAKRDGLVYVRVDDLNEAARAVGISVEVREWGGTREAHAVDPAGNRVRVAQALARSPLLDTGVGGALGLRSRRGPHFDLRHDGGYSSSANGVEYPVVLRNMGQFKARDVTLRSLRDGEVTDSKLVREVDAERETDRVFLRIPAGQCQLRPGGGGRVPRGKVSFEAWYEGRRVALRELA
jgi:hypothetical protein